MKESIKNIVKSHGKISVSFKSKINEWYGKIEIYSLFCVDFNDYEYIVEGGIKRQIFNNIDDAVDYFCYNAYTSKNIGYIQGRLMNSGKLVDGKYNFENPSQELKKIFKEEGKIINKEARLNGIQKIKNKFPTKEDAKAEIQKILPSLTIDNVSENLSAFKYKYLNLDPYLSVTAVYLIASKNSEFRSGSNLGYWTKQNIEQTKNSVAEGYKFKHLELCTNFDGNYERYVINV